MPTWASLIAGVLKGIGLVDAALAWEARWEAKRDGMAQQKAKDDAATVREDQAARKIDDAVSRLSDDELDKRLRAGPGQ